MECRRSWIRTSSWPEPGADAVPGVLKIGQMGARLPADDYPRVVLEAGKGGEQRHPRTRLAVAESDLRRL